MDRRHRWAIRWPAPARQEPDCSLCRIRTEVCAFHRNICLKSHQCARITPIESTSTIVPSTQFILTEAPMLPDTSATVSSVWTLSTPSIVNDVVVTSNSTSVLSPYITNSGSSGTYNSESIPSGLFHSNDVQMSVMLLALPPYFGPFATI